MFQLIGILIIINSLIVTGWLMIKSKPYNIWFSVVAIISGLLLLISERIVEISYRGFGIKAVTEKAVLDAGEIEKMRKRIETQSATIDLVANSANEAKALSLEAKSLTKEISEKSKQLNDLYIRMREGQEKLEELTEITKFIAAAGSGSRKAYNHLADIVASQSKFHELASGAIVKIRVEYGGALMPGYIELPLELGIESKQLTIEQLRERYESAVPGYHPAIIMLIKQSDKFSRKEKMQFFINVLNDENEDSLIATFYAGKFFSEFAQSKDFIWNPYVVKPLAEWWKVNKDKIQ